MKVEGDIDFDADAVGSLAQGHDLCVIGTALMALASEARTGLILKKALSLC